MSVPDGHGDCGGGIHLQDDDGHGDDDDATCGRYRALSTECWYTNVICVPSRLCQKQVSPKFETRNRHFERVVKKFRQTPGSN